MTEERARDSKLLIVIAIAGCLSFLVLIGVFVGMGYVRQVTIFWKEDIRTTVEFTNILGKVRVQGIVGNGGIDPTLVMKAGDTPYVLTVINNDTEPHIFYVEGLNIHTKLLLPEENDTITLISKNEATYSYYDLLHPERIIGKIISVRVEATD